MVPVKSVTFDVTGTLLFFRTPIIEKYMSVGFQHGIVVEASALKENFKRAWTSLNVEHPNFGRGTGLGARNWWAKFVERTFDGFKKSGEVKYSQIADDLLRFHSTSEAFTIRPGTRDLLNYLKTDKIRLGVISNYDGRLKTVLDAVELGVYFDFILDSYVFGVTKPDRRIFEEAMKLGKCSRGSECVHIGDDVELDYLGAKKAGMKAFLITQGETKVERDDVNSKDVFPDFVSIRNCFEKLRP